MIQKHITLKEEHEKVINEIIQTVVGVDNTSQAVRYLCMEYDGENKKMRERKLNAMSKELSILLTIITSAMSEAIDLGDITSYQNSPLYLEAKKIVEETIQSTITKKASKKNTEKNQPTIDIFTNKDPF